MASLAATIVPAVTTASGTVLIYDWLCTLDEEVMAIWLQPFTWSSALFYVNRYLAIVDVTVSVLMSTLTNLSVETCKHLVPFSIYSMMFGGYIGEWILMTRTYALWDCRRWVLITFTILGIAAFVPSIVITSRFTHGLIYFEPLPGVTYHGCSAIPTNNSATIVFVLLLCSETIIATLTAIKARDHLNQVHSSWVKHLYVQNGLLYYLYTLAISIANVAVSLSSPTSAALLIASTSTSLHFLHSYSVTHPSNPPSRRSHTLFNRWKRKHRRLSKLT
ncbi:hypothetical protein CYLTODRAFT_266876 [Cylindrobasidium torrendii FP15055 ss-10]|uniref:DUF6533 domain-containing protein n=1 Tax=Cylindrobasidium torrendii FP15055 ss-10 TaxID=1314674 RepID=A0A0D7BD47_9AGAR|nr:hypothetical protein CYLTODRAFT_266876 [Cylindrobasidium torrendii FP15055 ss-10]